LVDRALLPVKIRGLFFAFIFPLLSLAQETSVQETFPKWKWKGDIRLRSQQETTWPADMRISEKIRVRLGVKVDLESDLSAEFRLATAKTNSSANQSLGDDKDPGFTRRFFGLDLAYAEWRPLPFFKLHAGRIPQVQYRPGESQILLDADLALEGAAVVLEYSYDEQLGLFSSFGSAWLRENYDTYYSQKLTDNMLNWGQIGIKWKTQDSTTAFGSGFFNYTALQGMKFSDVSTGGTARGNSEAAAGVFKNSFIPRQYFIETKLKADAYQVGAFVEYVINGEAVDPNKAWWTGVSLAQERWKAQVAYGELQSDVVPGVMTDSDFAGGTTDAKGYVVTAAWKLKKNLTLGLSQYLNRKKLGLEDTQYSRTHLDLAADFSP
jgi:hypothetical protein